MQPWWLSTDALDLNASGNGFGLNMLLLHMLAFNESMAGLRE